MSRTALWVLIAISAAACGDDSSDDNGGKPGATAAAAPAAAAAAAAAANGGLVPMQHVEDRVTPKERANIRHVFVEQNFQPPQQNEKNRDPFQSFVVVPIGLAPDAVKTIQSTPQCSEKQMVASEYSYSELRLVGVVIEGSRRKVLMMDSGNLGHIIQRTDCVGKEKAFVSDIGDGYITFQVTNENSGNRVEEHPVRLHKKVLSSTEPPTEDSDSPRVAPIAAPPPTRGTSVPLPPLPPHGIAPPAIAAPGNAPASAPVIAPPPSGPPAPTTPQPQQRDDEQPGSVRAH